MDIARPADPRKRRFRLYAAGAAVVTGLGVVWLGVARLEPATPTVDRTTLWTDTVKRGPMVRQVRGPGTLVPEDIRWIPATTSGRVERIVVRPGTRVVADTVILELSNLSLQQELADARLRLRASEASLASLRVQVENETLAQEAATAGIEADYKKAAMQAAANQQLADRQLLSSMTLQQSKLDAEQLEARLAIARRQLGSRSAAAEAQLDVQQAEVEQARAVLALKARQVAELTVRAGVPGVLQVVPIDVGQQVAPGTNLARVSNPSRLKAELRIGETQAKDVAIGQVVSVDTHNGLAGGVVSRIDPSVQNGTVTVDVALEDDLPAGARPDLTVDGTIELERLPDVLYVGRPAYGQDRSTVGLFRLRADGQAERVPVTLGRSSVSTVEVLKGLAAGDQVVLSDMSAWDAFDRVRLR